jgi:hypothetical protein
MRIQFDINKKPEIISGKYRVVTRDYHPVRIIAWDRKGVFNIIALVYNKESDIEFLREYRSDGTYLYDRSEDNNDLFLINN